MKVRNVVSCFDGMSCGQIALNRANIQYENYFASEIDKHSIKVTQKNYPKTIQLGDINNWKSWNIDWSKVDVLFGGSPCQGFSFAGKQLAFEDPRSKLFFVFVEIWNHIQKHNSNAFFLLENVKMAKEHRAVISQYMDIPFIELNSKDFSAQNRERLYWTNIATQTTGFFGHKICTIKSPKDKGILLKDILENEVDEKYFLSDKMINWFEKHSKKRKTKFKKLDGNQKGSCLLSTEYKTQLENDFICVDANGRESNEKTGALTSRYSKGVENYGSSPFIKIDTTLKVSKNQEKANCFTAGGNSGGLHSDMTLIMQRERGNNQGNEFHEKSPTLTSNCWEQNNFVVDKKVIQLNASTESGGVQPFQQNRVYDVDGISPALSTDQRSPIIQIGNIYEKNAQAGRVYSTEAKSITLTDGGGVGAKTGLYETNTRIRRLTPVECERLQTVPDNYTDCVSDTQRYKMLGNGWTVDVIVYILKHI